MKAVLFDMDGILIDTEKYLAVYKQKAVREAGYRLTLETAYKFRSCASVFARKQMKDIFGEDFPYDELRRRRQELMSAHIERFGIEKKPYVEEVIQNDASGMMIIASDQKRFAISQEAAARIQV